MKLRICLLDESFRSSARKLGLAAGLGMTSLGGTAEAEDLYLPKVNIASDPTKIEYTKMVNISELTRKMNKKQYDSYIKGERDWKRGKKVQVPLGVDRRAYMLGIQYAKAWENYNSELGEMSKDPRGHLEKNPHGSITDDYLDVRYGKKSAVNPMVRGPRSVDAYDDEAWLKYVDPNDLDEYYYDQEKIENELGRETRDEKGWTKYRPWGVDTRRY